MGEREMLFQGDKDRWCLVCRYNHKKWWDTWVNMIMNYRHCPRIINWHLLLLFGAFIGRIGCRAWILGICGRNLLLCLVDLIGGIWNLRRRMFGDLTSLDSRIVRDLIWRFCIILVFGRRGLGWLGLFIWPRRNCRGDIFQVPVSDFFWLICNFFVCSGWLRVRSRWGDH